MKEILDGIAQFVNDCLGPLGSSNGSFYGWPDWVRDFIIQLLALVILFLIVRFFLWKPVTNFINAKAEAVDSELIKANEIALENQKINDELNAKMASAEEEIKQLLANANLEGQRRKETIINEAKLEAKRRIDEASTQIDLEVKRQKEDIKQAIVDIAFLAASQIAEREVSKEKYLSLVESIIESSLKDE